MSACDDWVADSNTVQLILPSQNINCHLDGFSTLAAGTYPMVYQGGCTWTYGKDCWLYTMLRDTDGKWKLQYGDDTTGVTLAELVDAGNGLPPEEWGWNPYANNNAGAWEGAYD